MLRLDLCLGCCSGSRVAVISTLVLNMARPARTMRAFFRAGIGRAVSLLTPNKNNDNGRYAHAKQSRRMLAALRILHSRVGLVHREIARQLTSPFHGAHLNETFIP